jgi:MFS family permease
MFLAFLQWKRPKAQSSLPLENFFESLTTAIRYVRYTPGIKILLVRHTLFSFFISIVPSLMVLVHRPFVFLVVAALGGMGWTLSASELWVASQRAMPDWASGRMNATMVMVSQAATALGGIIWGLAAHHAGVVPTFLGAAVLGALLTMSITRLLPWERPSFRDSGAPRRVANAIATTRKLPSIRPKSNRRFQVEFCRFCCR